MLITCDVGHVTVKRCHVSECVSWRVSGFNLNTGHTQEIRPGNNSMGNHSTNTGMKRIKIHNLEVSSATLITALLVESPEMLLCKEIFS